MPSALTYTVFHVVGNGSEKQVGRITARRVIAAVAYTLALWNCTVSNLIRYPVSAEHFLSHADFTVSVHLPSNERPTRIWPARPINMIPKTLFEGFLARPTRFPLVVTRLATEASLADGNNARRDIELFAALFALDYHLPSKMGGPLSRAVLVEGTSKALGAMSRYSPRAIGSLDAHSIAQDERPCKQSRR